MAEASTITPAASPVDPDTHLTKKNDGRTHLAHKTEHGVDLGNGALLAVTVQAADRVDTTTVHQILGEAEKNATAVGLGTIDEAVLDRGHHSVAVLLELEACGVWGYVAEPQRGRRRWKGGTKDQNSRPCTLTAPG